MNKRKFILMAVVVSVPLALYSCGTVGIEKLNYTVLEKNGAFEVRQYDSHLVAETVVNADFDQAGNIAFRRLFDYISGKNRSQESIAMTAPVNQSPQAEKIAMTAPVNMQPSGGKYLVSFVMPAEYTLQTLPVPLDENVVIRQVTPFKAAAARYSGTWSQERYEAKKAALQEFMQSNGLTATADDIFARYDPPFQLWFLRRNEVIIPVE